MQAGNLKSGNTTKCISCSQKNKIKDLSGYKFGKLLVNSFAYTKNRKSFWNCICECGKEVVVRGDSLTTNNTTSCGECARIEYINKNFDKRTHEKLYYIWAGMKNRCNNPHFIHYKHYGGRGIKVCLEWNQPNSYPIFKKWAISNGYKENENLTIDRIDVNGDYEPNNCRWVMMSKQNENKRINIYYTYNGKSKLLKDWAKILNINENTLYARINILGWSIEKAFTTKTNEI